MDQRPRPSQSVWACHSTAAFRARIPANARTAKVELLRSIASNPRWLRNVCASRTAPDDSSGSTCQTMFMRCCRCFWPRKQGPRFDVPGTIESPGQQRGAASLSVMVREKGRQNWTQMRSPRTSHGPKKRNGGDDPKAWQFAAVQDRTQATMDFQDVSARQLLTTSYEVRSRTYSGWTRISSSLRRFT